jgi:hypothetical protein
VLVAARQVRKLLFKSRLLVQEPLVVINLCIQRGDLAFPVCDSGDGDRRNVPATEQTCMPPTWNPKVATSQSLPRNASAAKAARLRVNANRGRYIPASLLPSGRAVNLFRIPALRLQATQLVCLFSGQPDLYSPEEKKHFGDIVPRGGTGCSASINASLIAIVKLVHISWAHGGFCSHRN